MTLTEPPDAATGPGEALPAEVVADLATSARWARVLAVVGVLSLGLLALGTLLALAAPGVRGRDKAIIALVILPVIALCAPPTRLLWSYSTHIRRFAGGRPDALERALRAAKVLWILLAILYGAGLLFGLVQVGLQLAGVRLFDPGP